MGAERATPAVLFADPAVGKKTLSSPDYLDTEIQLEPPQQTIQAEAPNMPRPQNEDTI